MSSTSSSTDQKPWVVALTGGIASGKTAVSDRFAQLGVPIIDTDIIARQVVEPGEPALGKIVEHFGSHVVDEHGVLVRHRLRKLIFSDPSARKKLESILHPVIMAEVARKIEDLESDYCIVVIPLLAEADAIPTYIDRVLLVDVDEDTQLERLMKRDGASKRDAKRALASQAARSERLAIADDIISNDEGFDRLDNIVLKLHEQYLAQAGSDPV